MERTLSDYNRLTFDDRLYYAGIDFGTNPLKAHPNLIVNFESEMGSLREQLALDVQGVGDERFFINLALRKAVDRLIQRRLAQDTSRIIFTPDSGDGPVELSKIAPLIARFCAKANRYDLRESLSDVVFWRDGSRREEMGSLLTAFGSLMESLRQNGTIRQDTELKYFISLPQAILTMHGLRPEVEYFKHQGGRIVPVLIPYYASFAADIKSMATQVWNRRYYGN